MKSGKYCKICKVELNEKNSYILRVSNLLCRKHYYQNQLQPHLMIAARRRAKKYEKKYNKLPRRKSQMNETAKRMYEKYPEKWRARAKLRYAIKMGKIKRLPCEVCKSVKSQAHHEDYSKPLDVKWVCARHHFELYHPSNLAPNNYYK